MGSHGGEAGGARGLSGSGSELGAPSVDAAVLRAARLPASTVQGIVSACTLPQHLFQ